MGNKTNKNPQISRAFVLEVGDRQLEHKYVKCVRIQMLMSAIENNKANNWQSPCGELKFKTT